MERQKGRWGKGWCRSCRAYMVCRKSLHTSQRALAGWALRGWGWQAALWRETPALAPERQGTRQAVAQAPQPQVWQERSAGTAPPQVLERLAEAPPQLGRLGQAGRLQARLALAPAAAPQQRARLALAAQRLERAQAAPQWLARRAQAAQRRAERRAQAAQRRGRAQAAPQQGKR